MFTPGIAAELINIPPSSLRRYVNLYAPFLSPAARKRPRLYNQADLTTIARVKELLSQGILIKDVPQILGSEQGKTIDQDQPQSKALALPGLISQIKEMQASFDSQATQLDQLQKRLTWLETPFYKRIGKKPPE
jgi:DNA-binding transcriptional MerR regulator